MQEFSTAVRVQRRRTHEVRNVQERLPDTHLAVRVKAVMHAVYKLEASPDCQTIFPDRFSGPYT